MMKTFHRCDSGLVSFVSLYLSPKYPPIHKELLKQGNYITHTFFNSLPYRDEALMNQASPSFKFTTLMSIF